MLTPEENERLTRVGPGTPCGELMRRYWIPIRPSAQTLENPVLKVRILSEDLVLFRDRSGALGLIGDRCLHRCVDLELGIPDERGLRCPYHGWLYSPTGECLERPLEKNPAESNLKIKAYPVQELGGLIFAYLGPLPAPPLPRWDLFVWPNAIRQVAVTFLDCNWLQCHENTGDPTHSAYTHGHLFKYVLERQGRLEERSASEDHTLHARIKVGVGIKTLWARETEYGFSKAIEYSKALGAASDELRQHSTVIFPFYTQTSAAGSPRSEYQIRVPIDDTHTYHICYQVYAAPPGLTAPSQDTVPWYEPPLVDDAGRPILDYVLAQDAYMWVAQGPVVDRSRELLGRTDLPIALLRRQLAEQIRRVEDGLTPMNVFAESSENIVHGSGRPPEQWISADWPAQQKANVAPYRRMYHRGFASDDADRYGPAIELVKELHSQIEAYAERWNAREALANETTD